MKDNTTTHSVDRLAFEEIQVLRQLILNKKAAAESSQRSFDLSVSTDETGNDREQASMLADQTKELAVRNMKTIVAYENALKRIENGTYGFCSVCGKRILSVRLQAYPLAEKCVECEQRTRKY